MRLLEVFSFLQMPISLVTVTDQAKYGASITH